MHYIFDSTSFRAYEIVEQMYNDIMDKDQEYISEVLAKYATSEQVTPPRPTVPETLSSVSINIAQVCNLSCIYCYAGDGEYGMKGKMTLTLAKKCIDFLIKESGNTKEIHVTFFGGEPLMNKPVLKATTLYAIEKSAEVGKKVTFSITTNGTLFGPDIDGFLNEHNFSVTISFDGDKRMQDKNRPFVGGKGSFDKILPLVRNFLRSRNGGATARATVTDKDTDVTVIKNTLHQYGFRRAHAVMATVSDTARDVRGVETIDMEDVAMKSVYTSLDQEAEQIIATIKQREPFSHELRMGKVYASLMHLFHKRRRTNFCGTGRRMLAIAVNGDIYPCHRFVGDENFKMGNIRNFDSAKRLEYTERFVYTHSECSKCWARFFCGGGGCIQDNLIMMKDVETVNPRYCAEVEYYTKHAIRIIANLNNEDLRFLTRK